MSPIGVLLNILWILCGGLWMAVSWMIAGAIMAISLIGIPWASVAFKFANYALLPFGRHAVRREEVSLEPAQAPGPLGVVRNLVWLLLAGWWLALSHLIWAVPLALTIIGLPFAWAHVKLAGLALWPVGKVIMTADEAEEARRRKIYARVRGL